ncbi:MAG TPA: aldehyde dehydrogenase family protein [Candidatus Limnocylindrales bacterium]|nr:aldehyde dehydrogenase family protein [Candidatus Limnocylindrales bacterium]
MTANHDLIAEIAREVLARLQGQGISSSADGVFGTVDEAVKAAAAAQKRVEAMSLAERGRLCDIVKRVCSERAEELARIELAETGLGRADHKTQKLKNIRYVLGPEAMASQAMSDTSGLCVIEHAPWGVIGMVLPATHCVPTLASNAINILASGNTAVFSPHPAGAKVTKLGLQIFNREIQRETGVANVLTTVAHPTIQAAEEMFAHPGVPVLCVTGGPGVVKAAGRFGKRMIAAGPGNPPVIVDETADLLLAASSIIAGASFDNNILCIAEKEVFVVAAVADRFIEAMRRSGAVQLDAAAIDRLTQKAFRFDEKGEPHASKEYIGKDTAVLARAAGVNIPAGTDLLFGETEENHPFVQEEQMMPFIPVVRMPDVDAAVAAGVRAEHGYRHTAIIHSRNFENVAKMGRALNCTLFVHNAPCYASLGIGGPSYLSHSIATPTGEGVTTPLTFTRERRIVSGAGSMRVL